MIRLTQWKVTMATMAWGGARLLARRCLTQLTLRRKKESNLPHSTLRPKKESDVAHSTLRPKKESDVAHQGGGA